MFGCSCWDGGAPWIYPLAREGEGWIGRQAPGLAPSSVHSRRLTTPVALSQGPQPQRVQSDESRRVLLVVGALVVLEGDEVAGIERLIALPPRDHDIALIEFE